MARSNKRDRRFTTYRLLLEDYAILRNLGKGKSGVKDRHGALLALIPIVRDLDMPPKIYKGIRIGIPRELDEAIKAVAKKTNHDFVDILLTAARIYTENPDVPETTDNDDAV